MSFSRRSNVVNEGMSDDGYPDYIYFNADIINNTSADTLGVAGNVPPDPQIRFNETRDTALVSDTSKYDFTIVRFTMDGPGLDLPILIPTIELGQSDVNKTTYKLAITYQQTWNTNLGPIAFAITPTPTYMEFLPENYNTFVAPVPAPPLRQQDITTDYYYVNTFTHFVSMFQTTVETAYTLLYTQFAAQWAATAGLTDPFPFPTYANFKAYVNEPQLTYDNKSKLFSIFADSDGFGTRITNFTPVPYVAGVASPQTKPTMRMFFNTNLYGLLNNFYSDYWNTTNLTTENFPNPVPFGYTYEILFYNNFYQNVVDYRLAPYAGVPPLGVVPIASQKVYYRQEQDYQSTGSLWSPIASIVFTTTLIPIKYEATGQPNVLGTGNLGDSAPTSLSAFQPIITDIALDTSTAGPEAYRQFTYYSPVAEYRMTDFGSSKQEIRNIDIQVFWKNRLDGNLYPINMYNLSSVSVKCLFRKKHKGGK